MKKNNTLIESYPSKQSSSLRVGRLDTLADVRTELAKLYRSARKSIGDELDVNSATKLAYLLNCIGRSLEGAELERRINEIELRQKEIDEQNKKTLRRA